MYSSKSIPAGNMTLGKEREEKRERERYNEREEREKEEGSSFRENRDDTEREK